jgi:hypothetical protein
MIDRTTKILLAAIAFGLWANAGVPLLRATPAYANDQTEQSMLGHLQSIKDDIKSLVDGHCLNKKLC